MSEPLPRSPSAIGLAIPPGRVGHSVWVHAGLLVATACTMVAFWVWHSATGGMELPSWSHVSAKRLRDGCTFAAAALAILGAHELGHYWACRRYGIPATLPYFLPGPAFGTFGAVIRIRGVVPHRRALFDVAAAGPLAGFVVTLPVLIAGIALARPAVSVSPAPGEWLWFGHSGLTILAARLGQGTSALEVGPLYVAAWFGLLVTSMNLFPVGQLDGGHATYAVSQRLHSVGSWISIVALGAFVALEWWRGRPSVYTLWCAVLLWMRARHPRLGDESVPLDAFRVGLAIGLWILFALTFMARPLILM